MDCPRRKVLACIAYASDRCYAIDTLDRNHLHNKLMEGPDPDQTMHRTSQEQRSQISSPMRDPDSGFPSFALHLWQRRIMSNGALHQIATGRVCNNNVDQSVSVHNSSCAYIVQFRVE